MPTVYVRANRQAVREAIRDFVLCLGGHAADHHNLARFVQERVGMALLGRIKTAFGIKADGGTDEAGEKWRELAPATKAKRRRKKPSDDLKILRDNGVLLNSLSPGVPSKDQVFRMSPGEVVVGTNVPYGSFHHQPTRAGRPPQRRLWPEPNKWPKAWRDELSEAAKSGVIEALTILLGALGT